MSIFIIQFGLLFVLLQSPTQTPAAQATPEPPKPTVNISFARQTIRENDCLPVEVWFSNEGPQEITEVTLQIASPGFLRWSLNPCNVNDTGSVQSVPLELAASGQSTPSSSIRSRKLYLKTGSDIDVGDYNLFFTLQYGWKAGSEVKQSLIASEKSIKANFLGSESVAGVPLGLAGLIVPGLFFWIVVRGLGVSWSMETPLGDKLIYSVVVSFIFVALASALASFAPWLHYLDISSGISIRKLIWLAGTGAGVGLVVSLFDYLRRRRREKQAAEREINFSDDSTAIISKLLRKNSTYNPSKLAQLFNKIFRPQFAGYRPQTTVKLKNGEVYAGSLGERGKDLTMLAGWFRVTQNPAGPQPSAQLTAQLTQLRDEGRLFELITLAQASGFQITARNRVKRLTNGQITATNNIVMPWPSSEVLQVVVERLKSDAEALTL